jgi:hypothetical protein
MPKHTKEELIDLLDGARDVEVRDIAKDHFNLCNSCKNRFTKEQLIELMLENKEQEVQEWKDLYEKRGEIINQLQDTRNKLQKENEELKKGYEKLRTMNKVKEIQKLQKEIKKLRDKEQYKLGSDSGREIIIDQLREENKKLEDYKFRYESCSK